MPELLPRAQRVHFEWRRANPFGALALLRTHAVLLWLAAVNFLGNLAHAVLPSVSVLYLMYRYGWDERLVGLTLAIVGIGSIVVQGRTRGAHARSCVRCRRVLGIRSGANRCRILHGIPLLALWGLEGPASMALMSRLVGASEQGQLQGANASVTGIANLFGPALFTQTFAAAIGGGPRYVCCGSAVSLGYAPRRCRRHPRGICHQGARLKPLLFIDNVFFQGQK